MKQKIMSMQAKAMAKVQTFINDKAGSETTEKIGMVVVAVVIIGLLAAAVNRFMPGLFDSIGQKAQEVLMGIF